MVEIEPPRPPFTGAVRAEWALQGALKLGWPFRGAPSAGKGAGLCPPTAHSHQVRAAPGEVP